MKRGPDHQFKLPRELQLPPRKRLKRSKTDPNSNNDMDNMDTLILSHNNSISLSPVEHILDADHDNCNNNNSNNDINERASNINHNNETGSLTCNTTSSHRM